MNKQTKDTIEEIVDRIKNQHIYANKIKNLDKISLDEGAVFKELRDLVEQVEREAYVEGYNIAKEKYQTIGKVSMDSTSNIIY